MTDDCGGDDHRSSRSAEGCGGDRLPELIAVERALEQLVAVLKERSTQTRAFKDLGSKALEDGDAVATLEAALAWRRQVTDAYQSVAERMRTLAPAFAAAVAEIDVAVRALVVRVSTAGLDATNQTELDALVQALHEFESSIGGLPALRQVAIAPDVDDSGWQAAQHAVDEIVTIAQAQQEQMQAVQEWVRLMGTVAKF